MTASTPATPDSRTELLKAVESHLRSNGDWNINDWREVADVLAAELAQTRQAIFFLQETESEQLAATRQALAGLMTAMRGVEFSDEQVEPWCEAWMAARAVLAGEDTT